MGGLFSNAVSRPCIEYFAFPAPKKGSYDTHHENLIMLVGEDLKIACMKYNAFRNKEQIAKRNVILYSHANATDIGQMHNFLLQLSTDLNTDIISYDYPSYGLSTGKPSESACNAAILLVYKTLLANGYQAEHIVLYGVSIGTGPSVKLASLFAVKACILQTPYTSIVGVVSPFAEKTMRLTESKICKHPNIFKNTEIIHQVKAPIAIIHGRKDEIISYEHARRLLQKANFARLVTLPNAKHNSIELDCYNELCGCLRHELGTEVEYYHAEEVD